MTIWRLVFFYLPLTAAAVLFFILGSRREEEAKNTQPYKVPWCIAPGQGATRTGPQGGLVGLEVFSYIGGVCHERRAVF
jgi:hypothetical protein